MKKFLLVVLLSALIVFPAFSADDVGYTKDYIDAMQKTPGPDRINAFKAYVKKYPDTGKQFTKLSFYWMTLDYFEVNKNYQKAIEMGEKTIKMGLKEGESARLALVLGNSFAIKGTSFFNKEKAMKYIGQAISLGTKANDKEVTKLANTLKKKMSAPPPKKMSPIQKISRHYSFDEFGEAIAYYKTLGAADKAKEDIHEMYAKSLFKANKLDSAAKEYTALYGKNKMAKYVLRLGDVYAKKGRRTKSLLIKSVNFYLEAGWLYKKEGNNSNSKTAFGKAQYQLFEKYGFSKKRKAAERQLKKQLSSASKNVAVIRQLKRDIRKQKRHIRNTYEKFEVAPPQWELDKVTELEKKLAIAESGGDASGSGDDPASKLKEEQAKILKEFAKLKAEAKVRVGA
ncbi:MAG: hypothetical protein GY765_34935 [bacterium]|nr:hypothetical protein [bacterium]